MWFTRCYLCLVWLYYIECRKSSNLNRTPWLFNTNVHSSQENLLLYKFNNLGILLTKYPISYLSHSFSFLCIIITSSLCVSGCHEKKNYNLQVLKEQSLKLGLSFSPLKVTDTKEKDEQRTVKVCVGWELPELMCYFAKNHKPQRKP